MGFSAKENLILSDFGKKGFSGPVQGPVPWHEEFAVKRPGWTLFCHMSEEKILKRGEVHCLCSSALQRTQSTFGERAMYMMSAVGYEWIRSKSCFWRGVIWTRTDLGRRV